MTHEHLCETCNTLFESEALRASFCSDICLTEGRRAGGGGNGCALEDGDEACADEDLDGAYLGESRLSVDSMISAMSGRGR